MPRVKKTAAKPMTEQLEQQLEEGVRPAEIKELVTEEGGKIASLDQDASKLQIKALNIEKAIVTATNMMAALVGAAETDLGKIQTEVLALASGEMGTDQLVAKYGTLTNAESAQKLATLQQVTNSIGVKIEEVKVQTKGLQLEEAKLGRVKQTFNVIGAVAGVLDAADGAAHQHAKVAINHNARQDDLNYTEGKRQMTKTRNEDNLAYRGEMNAIAKENEANIITHNQSVNEILQRARAVSRGILEASVTRRKFGLDAANRANNAAPQGENA